MIDSKLQNFDEILATTRSVRRRIDFDRAVDMADIHACVGLAVQAPTSVGDETWRFVVVDEAAKKARLAALYRRAFDEYLATKADDMSARGVEPRSLSPNYRYLADNIQRFPALILVCREGRPPDDIAGQLAFYGSVIPAAWSLMIALRSRRIGSTWTTLHALFESEVKDIIAMPDDTTACIMLPAGYMQDARLKRAARMAPTAITYRNNWGP